MKNWPHQDRALSESRRLFGSGCDSWCLVAPPGAGKSNVMRQIAIPAAENGKRVHIYVHRIMLTRQTIDGLEAAGADFGVIAAGSQYKQYQNKSAAIQVCMLDTVHARLHRAGFDLPKADVLIVDERHQMTGDMATRVFTIYKTRGARQIGFTATPVGLAGHVSRLVSAGSYSELRACKSHLPTRCFGAESPDTSNLKHLASGEYSSKSVAKLMRVPTIFGRVYDHWRTLNPHERPAIGYAPGVAESRWFVDEFRRQGVACAHIDGERTVFVEKNATGVLEAKEFVTDDATRSEIMAGSRDGHYKIVWNRFVLREAIDMPWLYHCILATAMGAESTYLQSVGRVQRCWPEYDDVIVQDHGGNIDRHDLPDIDRQWELEDTNNVRRKKRRDAIRKQKGDEVEPICCPKCCAFRTHGPVCPVCGHKHSRSVRMVRQLDGELVRKVGRVEKYRRPKTFADFFRSQLYAQHARGGSVSQAVGMARIKMREAGQTPPSMYDQEIKQNWNLSVRQAYPWATRRR